MGLKDLCEKYFQTTNLYEILEISEDATDREVKKAYHKLSLKVHPDRVAEDEKIEATEKFKVLGSIYAILTDKDQRAHYDETKSVDDDDFNVIISRDWKDYWRMIFRVITEDDIKACEKEYIGSDAERADLKRAYLNGKGDMDYIVDHVQFARTDQEARLRGILNEMIKEGEIPSYKKFTNESVKKRLRRIGKEKWEEKQAELRKKELNINTDRSLEELIKEKQNRAHYIHSYIDELAAKYGCDTKSNSRKRNAAPKTETATKNKRRK